MTQANAIPDEMEVYLCVYDLLVEMLKEPQYAQVQLVNERPLQRRNSDLHPKLELELKKTAGEPVLLVDLTVTRFGERLPCNYVTVSVADGHPLARARLTVFQKMHFPLYHYGDLNFGVRFAATYLAECALLAVEDEDMFMGVLAKRAFDRAQNRVQELYSDNRFSFYPTSTPRSPVKPSEGAAAT